MGGSMPRSFIEVLPRKRLLTVKPSGFSGEADCAVSKTLLKTSGRRLFRGKRSMNALGSDPPLPSPPRRGQCRGRSLRFCPEKDS